MTPGDRSMRLRTLIALFLALTVAACGGGGDSSTSSGARIGPFDFALPFVTTPSPGS